MVAGRLILLPVALSLLALPVAGCAGCSGDPARAGFSCGVANAVDGTYDRRIAERQAALASTQGTSRALQAELAASRSTLAALDADERSLQQQLARLDRDNRALSDRLDQARREQAASDATLRALEAELAALERRRTALADGPSSGDPATWAELEALQNQTEDLQRIIDGLIAGEGRIE